MIEGLSAVGTVAGALGALLTLAAALHRARNKMEEKRLKRVLEAIDALKATVDANERDRLRHVIFTYGSRVRLGERLASEEFRYLQICYGKYAQLGGNDIASDEYRFICGRYNAQSDFSERRDGK